LIKNNNWRTSAFWRADSLKNRQIVQSRTLKSKDSGRCFDVLFPISGVFPAFDPTEDPVQALQQEPTVFHTQASQYTAKSVTALTLTWSVISFQIQMTFTIGCNNSELVILSLLNFSVAE
jgi:hypothetical protein